MTTDERIDRLAASVDSLASSVLANNNRLNTHAEIFAEQDSRIEELLTVTELQKARADDMDRRLESLLTVSDAQKARADDMDRRIEGLLTAAEKQSVQIASLERQWQAYITTLPKN